MIAAVAAQYEDEVEIAFERSFSCGGCVIRGAFERRLRVSTTMMESS